MLLIVTNQDDPACDFLILRLTERQIPFLRLNTERYNTDFQLSLQIDKDRVDFTISSSDGRKFRLADVDGVFFRDPRLPDLTDTVVEEHRRFSRAEIAEQLRSLWRLIPQTLWLNHPRNLWLASNKIEQLHLAAQVGLTIPDTLVTSNPGLIRAFADDHEGSVIVKAIKHGFDKQEGKTLFAPTHHLSRNEISYLEQYAEIPAIYQALIPKKYDIRLILCGDRTFSTAILSQSHHETSTDWRTWDLLDLDLAHEAITLPKKVVEKCRKMNHSFGLKYSAIDLVMGQDGEFYFLEVNPNGQWAWIEQMVGYPIRDAIIETTLKDRSRTESLPAI